MSKNHGKTSGSVFSAVVVGLAVAVLLALKNKSLIVVAVASCVAVFVMDQIMVLIPG